MTATRRRFLKQLGYGTSGCLLLPGLQPLAWGAVTHPLPRSTPEAQGVSSSGIIAFLDGVAQKKFELHSFMMLRHGRVIAEGWWAPYGPEFNHGLYSLSKSYTSTAIGFAVAEGKLTVDDKVVSFFPNDLPENVSENLAALRIKDLLSMTVGHDQDPTMEVVRSENWAKAFLAWPIPHAPGTNYVYNSLATYMLSAIVQHVAGQTVLDYLQPRLFAPLGIEGATWETCPQGINTGGWGLSLPTEALAKVGQLYLQKGTWNGHEILPSEWIEEATSVKSRLPLPKNPGRPNEKNDWLQGYGYQFWCCQHHAYRGDGAFGQYMIVMPEQDAVVVITGEATDLQGELDLVWDHLLTAMTDTALPADDNEHAHLKQMLSALSLEPMVGNLFPGTELFPTKRFDLEPNPLGIESVRFTFAQDHCDLTFRYHNTEETIPCGYNKWLTGETALPGTPPRWVSGGAPKPGTKAKVAASMYVDAPESLVTVQWRYFETPHHDLITCQFSNSANEVAITFMNSMALRDADPKDGRPVLHGKAAEKG